MRKQWWAIAALVLVAVFATADERATTDATPFLGTWAGTWEGGGTGRFDLTRDRGGDGNVGGGVSVGTDQGDYTAKFTAVAFDGRSMKAKYDFPLQDGAEVAITGNFATGTAEGTWSLQPKGQEQSFAAGTWKVAKK